MWAAWSTIANQTVTGQAIGLYRIKSGSLTGTTWGQTLPDTRASIIIYL